MTRLYAGAALGAFAIALQASPTMAQEAPAAAQSSDEPRQSEIIVTGTRRSDLTAADAALPIDIISGDDLIEKGASDMNDLLRTEVPSLNIQRLVSNDGAVFTRPFSLRGLPPDQTLVLVNGKRRHRGATVQFTNVPYIRGSQGPDLAAIPSIAVGQLEVLRDGASALYGSDAIAGVLNFGLRRDREGGILIARYGQYYEGDGQDFLVQGNLGLPFTDMGFVNISGEYVNSDTTSRGIQRPDAQALINAGVQGVPVPAQRWGNPKTEAARIFVNAGLELSDNMDFYTFGNYSWSKGTTAFFYRNPNTTFIATSIPTTNVAGGPRFSFRQNYPGGFTPDFGATITDAALAAGLKGEFGSGLTYDVSASYGQNHASYRIDNTVNPSLGLTSPTSFKPGQLEQRELAFNLDLTYPINIGAADPLTLAGGLEYRKETYEITVGDLASWQVGPFASLIDPDTGLRTGLPVGSNGFPGFSPIQAGEFSRSNWAAYTSLEGNLTDAFQMGLAGRYENYSDFGSRFTWKVSGRYDFSDVFAVRGSVNTGFRAPTPGQSNASQVQTNIDSVTGAPLTSGIIAPNNPVAQFFGATPLKPEKSFNFAGGIVIKPSSAITFTLDYFNIKVEDRIAVSGNFNLTAAQRAQLAALGIPGGDSFQQVSFFTNSFDSRTQGVDAVLTIRFDLAGGKATLGLNGNYTKTDVIKASPVISADRERLLELEGFVPKWKGNASFNYEGDRFGFIARVNYYGKWTDYGANLAADQTGGAEVLVDLEASYKINDMFKIAIGGENVFDNFPDVEARQSQINNGIRYLRFAPTGFNGGFWYLRGTAKF
ncbi:TonB-dependent receptor [Novosphingobium sp. APW14]|jgi:iron complex outermembrane recepter protein|uniref:TonB-dependent receptor plug domain-containing protein n=1 Tax=Novosphingobium sp. APW14 TaxID=3077237 RepID=UPI0028DE291C|nr:TonB-dependent receptor [Novosphingobium sp. APW14]MDT9014106.1 TonB-dependent receptor [Novosphingobium sp. APW14]